MKMLGVERAAFHQDGLQDIVDDAHHHPAPDDQAHPRGDMAGAQEIDGRGPPDDGAAHHRDHRGRDHHRAPEGRLGQPENQEAHPSQGPLDKGDDHRAPQGGLDGGLGLPEDLWLWEASRGESFMSSAIKSSPWRNMKKAMNSTRSRSRKK